MARESMILSVRWIIKFIIYPMFYRFDVCWLRRTTTRELLLHVRKEFVPNNHSSIDNADVISLSLDHHIVECSIGGSKKNVKINMCGLPPLIE